MVRIGTVWDSALDAVRGRAGILLPIAALGLFAPGVIQAALGSYLAPQAGAAPSAGVAGLTGLLSIAVLLLTTWGALAVTAVTSHPDTMAGEAGRHASRRLLPLVGVYLVLGLAVFALLLPLGVLLLLAGVDLRGFATPGYRPEVGGAPALLLALYLLALVGLFLWAFARLLPIVPVVLHERLGLGAIGRAFRMTRGLGGKLVGVLLLYAVVATVASLAATSVVGLVSRLLLGNADAATAAFLGGVAGAAIGAALGVLSYTFVARLYAALSGRDLRAVFEDEPAR